MAAHGKLAWFLIVMCAAILVESQMFRQFTRGGGIRRGFSRFPTFSSSPRFVRLGQPIRPAFRRQQQQRRQQPRRTTVLQQTLVVNDGTNTPNSRQNQRSPRRNRLGAGGARRSSGGAIRTGSRGIPKSSFRRVPSIFSLGQRSPSRGRAAVRRPTINSRNLVRVPNHSSMRRAQPILLIPSGTSRGGARVGGSHSGGNRNIGNLGLSLNPGMSLRTGTSAGRGSGLHVGAGIAGGGAGHSTGSVGGIAADLGLNPGTATNLLAAGMGMDLAEINALTSLLGQSNQQNNVVSSLLGQNNPHSMQQPAPAVPAVSINAPSISINASPTGPSPTASSVNPQVILGQILGDNRREGAPGALQGDANERLIERIRAIDPNLLPPDV